MSLLCPAYPTTPLRATRSTCGALTPGYAGLTLRCNVRGVTLGHLDEKDFLWPYRMLDDKRKFALQIGCAMFAGKDWTNYGAVLAGASIAVLPTLGLFIAFQRSIAEGIALSGIK